MIYLASPYSDPDEQIVEKRYEAAAKATFWLLSRHAWVYSPIVHCHELAKKFRLPKEFDYWENYNKAMLRKADSLFILTEQGWFKSKGVQVEMFFSHELQMNRFLLTNLHKEDPECFDYEITPL